MPTLRELFNADVRSNAPARVAAEDAVNKAAGAPAEAQIAFLKELLKSGAEADKFLKDPKKYCVDHGMILDPRVVRFVTNSVLFDAAIDPAEASRLGEHAIKDIVDMRAGFGRPGVSPAAIPAAVAAGAAVVAAAAAVATLVVTLTRHSRPQDLAALSGLGPRGILLPGEIKFNLRGPVVR